MRKRDALKARDRIAENMSRKALLKAMTDMDNFEKQSGRELTTEEAILISAQVMCSYIEGYSDGMIDKIRVTREAGTKKDKVVNIVK